MSRVTNMLENFDGQSKIVDWYEWAWPTDEWGINHINPGATFQDAYECLQVGFDFYSFLGVSDSTVRERVFDALATLMGCDYDIIYYQWLDHGKKPLGGRLYHQLNGLRFHND